MVTTSTLTTPPATRPGPSIDAEFKDSRHVNVGQSERLLSAIGGGMLTLYGLTRGSLPGFALAAIGSAFIWRGASGHCLAYESLDINTADESRSKGIEIDETITVNRPRPEVFAFWRELSNLPRFMPHLESVTVLDDKRSHWVARAPRDLTTLEWDAEITQDFENERLGWCSLPGADIDNA
ncbi:MAG: SRPBCC family protein, partial [Planctomycetaceae bacterium]